MFLSKKVFVLLISAAILLFSNFAFSESSGKSTKPVENSEYNSLSAPTSDSPDDKRDRNANDRNLSSPPPHDSSTNNKPFDGNDKNKSSAILNHINFYTSV